MAVQVNVLIQSVFLSGSWAELTTPGSAAYHPLWAPFLVAETGFNMIFCVAWTYLVFLFLSKKKAFPKWFIWAHISMLTFLVTDMFALQLIRPDLPLLDPDTGKNIVRSMFNVCIWVPYMLVSTRVAATFTR